MSLDNIPPSLRAHRAWLVWRLIQKPEAKKPSKIPFYTTGAARTLEHGEAVDRASLATFDEAVTAMQRGGYNGVGFATYAEFGVTALDFDDVVRAGVVDPRVLDVIAGSYAEISPSGTGVRAFFRGTLPSRKDTKGDPALEVFGTSGFVTVTGNLLDGHALFGWGEVSDLTPSVSALYASRFGAPMSAESLESAGALLALTPTLGWTLEHARGLLMACDPGADRDHWLRALAALHHEFSGSDEALDLADDWSKMGANYSGRADVEGRWRSFGKGRAQPITGRWLLKWHDECTTRQRYKQAAQWKARIAAAPDEYTLRETVADEIGRDATLGDFERESLAQALADAFRNVGVKYPIAQCRKLVEDRNKSEAVPTVKTRRPLTEFGNAERMLDRYGSGLMYVPETDDWYVWSGVYWRKSTKVEIEHYAKETVRALVNELDDHPEPAEFFAFCAASQQARMVANMVKLASSDPRVLIPASALDAHPHLLGVQNGVVDLNTLTLLPADPSYRITRVCGAPYEPNAKSALFEQTLLDVFSGNAEMVEFMQRLVGYAACGQPTEDIMVIPFGQGSNGKSTVLGTIRRAFGTYAKAADANTFVSDGKSGGSAGGAREDLVRLHGARFVYVNEPDEGSELREGSIKSMTGGDAMPARGLFAKASIEITPTWVVLMPTNHKPIVKGTDNGIWRRLMLLPFERNFDADPLVVKDTKREEKLMGELTGVLAWILRGAREYKRVGLGMPASVKQARESYRSQMDLLAEWLDECCETDNGYSAEMSKLWESWEGYAKARGLSQYIRSSIALGRRLDSRFPAVKGTGGVRLRVGLRLRDPFSGFTSAP